MVGYGYMLVLSYELGGGVIEVYLIYFATKSTVLILEKLKDES